MLTALRRYARFLLEWSLLGRHRADELRVLRQKLSEPLRLGTETHCLRHMAEGLKEQREALAAAFGAVDACGGCVRPHLDEWPGGHCCSGSTAGLFTHDEIAALRLAGTKPAKLLPPSAPQFGCAFRGRSGCSLAPAHRPSICVRYTCRELEVELRDRGTYPAIAAKQQRLKHSFDDFCRELHARDDDDDLGSLKCSRYAEQAKHNNVAIRREQ